MLKIAKSQSLMSTANLALLLLVVVIRLQCGFSEPAKSHDITRTVTYSKPAQTIESSKSASVAPAPSKNHQPTAAPSKNHQPTSAPSKVHRPIPVCLDPSDLGVPFIHTCEDLKIYAKLPNSVHVQEGLEDCQWMDDLSCGGGMRGGSSGKKGTTTISLSMPFNEMTPGVGNCLTLVKKFDGTIYIEGGSRNPTSEILCCRPLCMPKDEKEDQLPLIETETPTYPPLPIHDITTTPRPREDLLDLTEAPDIDYPRQIPINTTPRPISTMSSFTRMRTEEMCIAVEYLNIPRVRTCEDLRDAALSTDFVTLTNMRAADCSWIDDYTCGPSYPGHGAYLTANLPDGACLGYRQSYCGNLVGPYPILQHDVKQVCARPGGVAKQPAQQQMMPIMIPVPNAAPGKKGGAGGIVNFGIGGGRRLAEFLLNPLARHNMIVRKLQTAPGKKGGAGGENLVLCCRLSCGGRASMLAMSSVMQRTSGSMSYTGGGYSSVMDNGYGSGGGGGGGVGGGYGNGGGGGGYGSGGGGGGYGNGGGGGGYGNGGGGGGSIMPASGGGGSESLSLMGNGNGGGTTTGVASLYGDPDSSADVRMTNSLVNHIDICNPRFANFCSFATPMTNEEIVFDQQCNTPNAPLGCYAGGLTCCRSVPKYNYGRAGY